MDVKLKKNNIDTVLASFFILYLPEISSLQFKS
jgi:hypothetical protein